MRKLLIILGFMLMFTLLNAQSTSNYYYANGVPQYWTDDSTPRSPKVIAPSFGGDSIAVGLS